MTEITYREAVTRALADELETDPDVFLLGEDIGAAGGVFKTTQGLQEQFGVRIVVDRMSAPYLDQAKVDFLDTLEQSGFTIDNPLAQGGCACGHSFH